MADTDVDISQLAIEVGTSAGEAIKDIDALGSALSRLGKVSSLTRITNSLERLSDVTSSLKGVGASVSGLEKLPGVLTKLAEIPKPSGLNSAMNALKKLPDVINNLDSGKVKDLANMMPPLAKAFGALGAVQKPTGLRSTLTALGKVPEVLDALKKADAGTSVGVLDPISKEVSKLAAIPDPKGLKSVMRSLRKLPETVAELKKVDMAAFSLQVEQLRKAVVPLAAEMEKVSKGFSSLPANIQKAINANAKLTDSNNKAGKSYNFLGVHISKALVPFGGLLFILRRLARYLGGALANFNSYVENVNLFNVSMGEYAEQATAFAQSLQDVLGVDMSEAMRNMGILQNLTTSFGVANEQAYILSKNLTQLGYDMASFFNLSTADTFTKLQAAISGELEPIRRVGVDISAARLDQELLQIGDVEVDLSDEVLQQELYSRGLNVTVKSLNQADKALLRYIAIMKQTANAQTDMGRTLNSPANMIRVFQAQITLLGRSIGSLLIPMLNSILPPMIAATQILREFVSAIASFFNVEVKMGEMGEDTNIFGGVSAGLDKVADSANGAAKEMSYLIGGFDELNVLPSAKGLGGAAGGAGAGNLLSGIELPEYDMFANLVKSQAAEWVEKLRRPLTLVFSLVTAIGLGFLAWKIGKPLVSGVMLVGSFLKDAYLLMAAQPELLGKAGQQILKWLGPLGGSAALILSIASAAVIIALRFADLLTTSEKFRQGLSLIWETIKASGTGLWEGFLAGVAPVKQALSDLGQTVLGLIPVQWREPIATFFKVTLPEALSKLDLDFGDLAITLAGIGLMFVPGGQIVGVALLAFEAISVGIRGLGLFSDEQVESIKQGFSSAFHFIGELVGGVISGIVRFITTAFGGVLTFLSGVFSRDWGKIFGGLLQVVVSPIMGIASLIDSVFGTDIVQSVKNAINKLIGYFNQFLSWLNSFFSFRIPSFNFRGKKTPEINFGLNLGQIPLLADGGVLTSPQLVMAGEYSTAGSNPEIVTPQSIMRETVTEANAEMVVAIVAAIRELQQTVEEKDTSTYISAGDVGRAAVAYGQQQKRRTGKNPFETK